MAWVMDNTDPNARFAVVSGRHWAVDAEAEWFPALTGRRNVTTVQGSEWLGRDRFRQQVAFATKLPVCIVRGDAACVGSWFSDAGPIDYLFLVDTPPAAIEGFTCCHRLVDLLASEVSPHAVHADGSVLVVRLAGGGH